VNNPIVRYGGKATLAPWIVQHVDRHRPFTTYVEPFGGAANVLISLPPTPSVVEVYNDLDESLANLFTVLASPKLFRYAHHLLEVMPYSRGIFDRARDDTTTNAVMRAVATFITLRQSFNASETHWKGVGKGNNNIHAYLSAVDGLPALHTRLRTIHIECAPYTEVLDRYDSETTLFYLDPPYPHETREQTKSYALEMSIEDHAHLLNHLLTLKAHILLSTYPSTLYDTLEQYGWTRFTYNTYTPSGNRPGAAGGERREILWSTPHGN